MITARREPPERRGDAAATGQPGEPDEPGAPGAPERPEAGAGAPAGPGAGDDLAAQESAPPPAGAVTNLVVAAVVVALGAAGLAGSWSLGLGSAAAPSAGMWPFLVSGAIAALGVALLFRARATRDAETFSSSSWLVVAGLATMAVFAALIGVIGFEIPSAALAFVWLRFIGGESWRLSVLTSLGIVVAFYLLFVAVLAVPIPHLF